MSGEAHENSGEQFEHALATVFACRSMVKYNTPLSEEQRNELLADIDTTLRFLRDRLVINASIETKRVLPQLLQAGILPPGEEYDDDGGSGDERNDRNALRSLYQIYHTYTGMQQGSARAFTARFNEAMAAIAEIQSALDGGGERYGLYGYVASPLQRVGDFIADLYCLFMEFMRALSGALEGSSFYIDTEEISTLRRDSPAGGALPAAGRLVSLIEVFETHWQLNARRGALTKRVGDAAAFLVFLEEGLGNGFNKQDEVVAQLDKVSKLLSDLSGLLSEYEDTVAMLLREDV